MSDGVTEEAEPSVEPKHRAEISRVALGGLAIFGVGLLILTSVGLYLENERYVRIIGDAREATRACPGVYLAFASAMAPYESFTWFRSTVVFLSFIFVYAGAAFTLARVRAAYEVEGQGPEGSSLSVKSAYPGVLMMLMGAVLVAYGLNRSANPNTENLRCQTNPAWSKSKQRDYHYELSDELSLSRAVGSAPDETENATADAGVDPESAETESDPNESDPDEERTEANDESE